MTDYYVVVDMGSFDVLIWEAFTTKKGAKNFLKIVQKISSVPIKITKTPRKIHTFGREDYIINGIGVD